VGSGWSDRPRNDRRSDDGGSATGGNARGRTDRPERSGWSGRPAPDRTARSDRRDSGGAGRHDRNSRGDDTRSFREGDRSGRRDDRPATGGYRRDDRGSADRDEGRGGHRGSTGGYERGRSSGDRGRSGDRSTAGYRKPDGYRRNDRDATGGERPSYAGRGNTGDRHSARRDDPRPFRDNRDDRPPRDGDRAGTSSDRGGYDRSRRDDRPGYRSGTRGDYRRDDRAGARDGRESREGRADGRTGERAERNTYRRPDRDRRDDRETTGRATYRQDDRRGGARDDRETTPRKDDRRSEARDDRRPAERPTYRVWDDPPRGDRPGGRDRRPGRRDDFDVVRVPEPPLPDDVTAAELDAEVRRDLRGLQKDTADSVARHLVAAGTLVDDDPVRALAHARYARQRASRIAAVREAAGIAAYHAGEWSEALGELRAARRMGGGPGHLAVMADIERALGRPERAIELTRGPETGELGPSEAIELAIVAAGARRDLGELDAAVVGLQLPELDPARRDPWSARLFYAYADNLLAAGRESDAVEWFVHAADVDDEGETDAAVRLAELTGAPVPDDVAVDVEEDVPDAANSAVVDESDVPSSAADLAGADTADDAPSDEPGPPGSSQ
jgi:hypothetical protein